MGHTNYMSNRPAFTDAQWAAFTKAARKLLASTKIPLAGPNGEPGTKPEIDDHWVAFNGVGEDAHETAAVEREANEFEFCKTAEKPYDEVVVAFYKLVRKHLPSTRLSSDGGDEVFG